MKPKWINDKVIEMKRLFAWGLLLLLCLTANATDLLFNLSEFNAFPTNNRTIQFQAQTPFVGNNQFITSTADGMVTNFNVPLGVLFNYTIKAPPANIVFQIYVPSDTAPNALIDATNFTSIGPNAATYPSGQVAPSIQFADARYARSGGSLTNSFYPSSNPSNFISVAPVNLASNYLSTNINANLNNSSNVLQSQFAGFVSNNGGLGTNNVFKDTQTYGNSTFIGFLGNFTLMSSTISISKSNIMQYGVATSNEVGFLLVTNSANVNGTLTLNGIPVLTNATVVTNGLATTNYVIANFYPTSNPSLFVTSAVTNLLASIQLVNTNGVNGTNFSLLIGLQGTNNSTFVSNGLAALTVAATNSGIFVFTNRWIDTNVLLVKLINTNSINGTNFALRIGTEQTNNVNFVSNALQSQISAAGVSPTLATNIANSQIFSATNGMFVYSSAGQGTNINVWSNLSIGGLPAVFLASTNVVGVWNAGVPAANGTYTLLSAGLYTNTSGNGSDIAFSNPTWFIDTNNVHLYSASSLLNGTTWNNVVGSSTTPNSSYGYTNNMTGIVFANFTAPTNTASSVYVNFTSNSIMTNFWSLNGNSTVAGATLGSTNGQPLTIAANGTFAARFLTNGTIFFGNSNSNLPGSDPRVVFFSSMLGGVSNVFFTPGSTPLYYAVICGGNSNTMANTTYGFVGNGNGNSMSGNYNFIGNGALNNATASYGFVGNGTGNRIGGNYSSVLNGNGNYALAPNSTILSGETNLAVGQYSLIGGGAFNFTPSHPFEVIIMGFSNINHSGMSTILNGSKNNITSTGDDDYSAILGGSLNSISNSGSYILGGTNKIGANNSFIVGYNAQITNSNTFVYSDGTAVKTFTNNSFLIYNTGGIGINTNYSGTNAMRVYGYVDAEGFTVHGAAITGNPTNGLATTNWVNATFYPTSNPSLFVTSAVTNGLAAYLDLTNQITRTNTLLVNLINTNSINGTNFIVGTGASATNNDMVASNNLALLTVAATNSGTLVVTNRWVDTNVWLTKLAYTNSINISNTLYGVGAAITNGYMQMSNTVYVAATNAPASVSAFNATNNLVGTLTFVATNKYLTTNDNGRFLTSINATNLFGTVFDLTNAYFPLQNRAVTNTQGSVTLSGNITSAIATNAATGTNGNIVVNTTPGGLITFGNDFGVNIECGNSVSGISLDSTLSSISMLPNGQTSIRLDNEDIFTLFAAGGFSEVNKDNVGFHSDGSGSIVFDASISATNHIGNGMGLTNIPQSNVIGLTNSLASLTNYVNARLIGVTNLTPYNVLVNSDIGTNSIWQLNTNIISVQGAANSNFNVYANGLYVWSAAGVKWTNSVTGTFITNNVAAGKYNLLTGTTTLYQTPTLNPSSWTTISGAAPPPNNIGQSYGVLADFAINGAVLTNLPQNGSYLTNLAPSGISVTGSTAGMILTATPNGAAWSNAPAGVPSGLYTNGGAGNLSSTNAAFINTLTVTNLTVINGVTNGLIVINTNLALNGNWTNNYGVPIIVSVQPLLTAAAAAGMAQLSLQAPGNITNRSSIPLTIAAGLTGVVTNGTMSTTITNGGSYTLKDTSTAGSAGVGWCQITYVSQSFPNGNIINSGNITLDNSTTAYTWTHGLGRTPRIVNAVLVCTATDSGWGTAAGDEIDVTGIFNIDSTSTGFTVYRNTTLVIVSINSPLVGNETFFIANKKAGPTGTPSDFNHFALKIYAQ